MQKRMILKTYESKQLKSSLNNRKFFDKADFITNR